MKTSRAFQKYLDRMRKAHLNSQAILQQWSPSHETVQASLACAWELFFDILHQQEEASLADINTISGIIQKLSSCHHQISAMESKNRGEGNEASEISTTQLSQEIIETIEQQLQLL